VMLDGGPATNPRRDRVHRSAMCVARGRLREVTNMRRAFRPLALCVLVAVLSSRGACASSASDLRLQTSPDDGEWSGPLPLTSGPVARHDHALIDDPVRDRLVLFGGADANGAALGDVWVLPLSGPA